MEFLVASWHLKISAMFTGDSTLYCGVWRADSFSREVVVYWFCVENSAASWLLRMFAGQWRRATMPCNSHCNTLALFYYALQCYLACSSSWCFEWEIQKRADFWEFLPCLPGKGVVPRCSALRSAPLQCLVRLHTMYMYICMYTYIYLYISIWTVYIFTCLSVCVLPCATISAAATPCVWDLYAFVYIHVYVYICLIYIWTDSTPTCIIEVCVALRYDQRQYNASWVHTRCIRICTFIRIYTYRYWDR